MNNVFFQIKQRRVVLMHLFLLCLTLTMPIQAKPFPTLRSDSLQACLSATSNSNEKILLLRQLSIISRQSPAEVNYLTQLLNVATDVDSLVVVFDAAANLARYYYNRGEMDSLHVWVAYIDSVSEKRKQYSDAFFNVHSYVCQGQLWRGNYELAMNDAIRLQNLAHQENHSYGMICCSENLGLIYQEIRRDSDAIVAFQESLKGLNLMENSLPHRISLISNLLESYLRTNRLAEGEEYLKLCLGLLNEQEQINQQRGDLFPVSRFRKLVYSFYIDLYLKQNNLSKAAEALEKAAGYKGSAPEIKDYANFIFRYNKARYLKETGNYSGALAVVDELLQEERMLEELKFKVEILLSQGKFEEVVPLYKEIITLAAQINNDGFNRQINQLRTLYDLNNKEIQARELELSKVKITTGQHQLILSMSVSFILLILLYILYNSNKRTRQLKNALLQEKNSLIESERLLRIAKEHAEEANQIKSTFIAGMSHEIRTPLNAIVGFSSLLADPDVEEEKKQEFATIISNNSELLLNLVHDVLDISALEVGNMKFNIEACNVVTCCHSAMNSIRHRLLPGVELSFSSPCSSFILETDSLRLQQLLINLLANAAKFTEKGEINLSLEIDGKHQQIILAVTDTGCGVPSEMQQKIFEQFEKVDEHTQGSGLGLSICQIIADKLGGTVSLDLSYTQGARFVFIHPWHKSANKNNI